jgi:hypothetical protein
MREFGRTMERLLCLRQIVETDKTDFQAQSNPQARIVRAQHTPSPGRRTPRTENAAWTVGSAKARGRTGQNNTLT